MYIYSKLVNKDASPAKPTMLRQNCRASLCSSSVIKYLEIYEITSKHALTHCILCNSQPAYTYNLLF